MSRVAVVGAGISGMSAAYYLSARHEVWLFERDGRLGGHTHTVRVNDPGGPIGVDTGFIVFNERNYPNLVRLFAELGIASQPSDMCFSVADPATGFAYSSRGLNGFFADRRNLLRPGHYRLLAEIRRFHRRARALLPWDVAPPAGHAAPYGTIGDLSLGAWLDRERFTRAFRTLFLYPMIASIWSTSPGDAESFPACMMARFFHNHGLLQMVGNPQWRVVTGGSSTYIAPLTAPVRQRTLLNAAITGIVRGPDRVTIHLADREAMTFDHVVLACHGDEVLPLLADPTPAERDVFEAFRTSSNEEWLHTDSRVLPALEAARASWNYRVGDPGRGVTLTYHMNRLQRLTASADYCVTLEPAGLVDESTAIARLVYRHPIYTPSALRAQQRWSDVSGIRRTHYCGAYWFSGFHEDGVRSALRVVAGVGAS
jgi:predicted NAD/FAD-binding protein